MSSKVKRWLYKAAFSYFFYHLKNPIDGPRPYTGTRALSPYRPHGTALIPYKDYKIMSGWMSKAARKIMMEHWNSNHGYPDYQTHPSGHFKISYFRKWRKVPKQYWGLRDMTHWKDNKGTQTSASNEQKFSDVTSILHKDSISSNNLGIDDFIDINTANTGAEGLNFLVKQVMVEGTMMNMQPSGAWVEIYLIVARRDLNVVPTTLITTGLESESASATDYSKQMGIKPWDSEEFNRFWKVKRTWKKYLEAGEQIKFDMQFELNKEFNVKDIMTKTDGILAGITHYLIMRQWGQLATEDASPSEVGYTTTRVNWHFTQKINFRVVFEENYDRFVTEATTLDTLTAPVWPNVETHEEDAVSTL